MGDGRAATVVGGEVVGDRRVGDRVHEEPFLIDTAAVPSVFVALFRAVVGDRRLIDREARFVEQRRLRPHGGLGRGDGALTLFLIGEDAATVLGAVVFNRRLVDRQFRFGFIAFGGAANSGRVLGAVTRTEFFAHERGDAATLVLGFVLRHRGLVDGDHRVAPADEAASAFARTVFGDLRFLHRDVGAFLGGDPSTVALRDVFDDRRPLDDDVGEELPEDPTAIFTG